MADTNYQTLNAELEGILAKLQDPDIEVDEAVVLYEQGVKLIAKLEKHLTQAENKLTKLKQNA
ncbi:MAG TPA: exodeoxyribonuclease VII small subunit [Candidatus Saccharimonadales bacterium]|nr:exodeoxyribonuclease VII small subunit [Candidatus Saccharimonadales bacterium]